jgi:hypothetical protein
MWLGLAIGVWMAGFFWLLDLYLALRKRVAELERHVGVGAHDRIVELMGEESPDS